MTRVLRQVTSPEVHELHAFLDAFRKESDRGAVLVAASRIDEILKTLLRSYLRDTKSASELLENSRGPLGTFASRACAAHALALIEDHEFREITLIRKIRNEFGHEWRDIGFVSQRVRSFCTALPWLGPKDTAAAQRTGRLRFSSVVAVLLTDLLWREHLVVSEQRTARQWTNTTRRSAKA